MKQSFKSFVPEKVMKDCKGEKFLEKKSINFVAKAPSRIHPSQVDIKRIKTLFSIDSGKKESSQLCNIWNTFITFIFLYRNMVSVYHKCLG